MILVKSITLFSLLGTATSLATHSSTPAPLSCEPLQKFEQKVCSNLIDYNVTIRPNIFGHMEQEESHRALLEYDAIFGGAETVCAESFELFVCALYLPQCVIVEEPTIEEQPAIAMNTCYHTLCVDAREHCQPWLDLIGMTWPFRLDCDSLFRVDPPDCFYPALKRSQESVAKIAAALTLKPDEETSTTTTTTSTTSTTASTTSTTMTPTTQSIKQQQSWIHMNVGGKMYLSTRATLCRDGEDRSLILKKLFECDNNKDSSTDSEVKNNEKATLIGKEPKQQQQQEGDVYLLDRDANYFRVILNYLRSGKLMIDDGLSEDGVLEEANYFNLPSLAKLVKRRVNKRKQQSPASANMGKCDQTNKH